jgi:CheY-like chemotaxis protein/HPt (histidine-containing phosphotransfer) domain-containing protein
MRTRRSSSARNVLHVDDNVSNLRLVERVLALRPGTEVVAVRSGAQAVELAHETHAQLVLLDVRLPDVSGYDVLRQLRADPRTSAIPVVMISADATPDSVERCLAAGADGYLAKPFDINELLDIVDSTPPAAGQVADPAAGADDGDVLDEKIVSRLRELYPPPFEGELSHLMAEFIGGVDEQVDRLHDAAAVDDAAAVERLAHDLRGNTGMYGARHLPGLFGQLERLAGVGNLTGAASVLELVELELARVETAIRREFSTP